MVDSWVAIEEVKAIYSGGKIAVQNIVYE